MCITSVPAATTPPMDRGNRQDQTTLRLLASRWMHRARTCRCGRHRTWTSTAGLPVENVGRASRAAQSQLMTVNCRTKAAKWHGSRRRRWRRKPSRSGGVSENVPKPVACPLSSGPGAVQRLVTAFASVSACLSGGKGVKRRYEPLRRCRTRPTHAGLPASEGRKWSDEPRLLGE